MSLYRLISTYWTRYAELDEAMDAAASIAPKTAERVAADAKEFAAGDALGEAAVAVLAFVPTWSVDAVIKAAFVANLVNINGGSLETEEVAALTSTLSSVYAPREGGAQ